MITFVCPRCGIWLRVGDECAGKNVRCGGCQTVLAVPARAATVAPPSGPPTIAPERPPAGQATLRVDAPTLLPSAPGGAPAATAPEDAEPYAFLGPPQAAGEMGRLGGYRVLRVLGQGGMGVVFEAEDVQLRRRVAIKALLPALAASPAARQRFLREARAAAAVRNDHVVTIYQVGEDRGTPFVVMELLQGESLEAFLRRGGRLPVAEILRLGRETAEGLAAAHEQGLIHRDVKPANLWLEAGRRRVKLLDFGLARAASEDHNLTQSGVLLGTPGYLAPEQTRGGPPDPRSDLFSLGCVLYRLCTGDLPFQGQDTLAMLMALATQTPRPVRERNPQVPAGLAALVGRLLAKDPNARPASARAVAQELAALGGVRAGDGPAVRQPTPGPLPPPAAPAADADSQPILGEVADSQPILGEVFEPESRTGRAPSARPGLLPRKLSPACLLAFVGAGVAGLALLGLVTGAVLLVLHFRGPAADLGPDREVRTLPASATDAAVGGGGRYLILAVPARHQLAVIDLAKPEPTRFLDIEDSPVRLAADIDKLLVVYTTRKVVERWSLATWQKEATADVPFTGRITTLALGSASGGPLLVLGEAPGLRSEQLLLDVRQLRKVTLQEQGQGVIFAGDITEALASAEGRVFGVGSTNFFSRGSQTVVVGGGQATYASTPTKLTFAAPGPDGRVVYTNNGLYTTDLKDLPHGSSQRGTLCVPALQGDYYARIRPDEEGDGFSLCLAGDDEPLTRVTDVGWPGSSVRDTTFPCWRRLFLVPAANRIVSVPPGNDHVILQRFDFARALEKATSDYLFVTSFAPPPARPGSRYGHDIRVQARKGPARFRLVSGPRGLTVSPSGSVRWDVPADLGEPAGDLTVQVQDAAGHELSHALRIPVE
jgi:serine/threonine protein kinase